MSPKNNLVLKLFSIFLVWLTFLPSLHASDDQEPLFEEMKKLLHHKSFTVRALLQTVADFQRHRSFSGNNGFSIATTRLSLSGDLDKKFSYFFQFDFTKSPAVLDAKLSYQFSTAFGIDAGLFKTPFSREYLTYAANIDFINRSQVVSILAPKRQIGFQFSGSFAKQLVRYNFGAFNGNGLDGNNNDNDKFLYVGRLSVFPKILQSDYFEIGVNYAESQDERISFGNDFINNFNGKRALIGADFRLILNKFLVSGEFISAKLEPRNQNEITPKGYQATVGYFVNKKSQLLVRWDSFDADGGQPKSEWLILGYNFFPTQITELQVNYVMPVDETSDYNQLLINLQLSF